MKNLIVLIGICLALSGCVFQTDFLTVEKYADRVIQKYHSNASTECQDVNSNVTFVVLDTTAQVSLECGTDSPLGCFAPENLEIIVSLENDTKSQVRHQVGEYMSYCEAQ